MAVAMAFFAVLASCTKETLCEQEHPHKADVQFAYDWTTVKGYSSQQPDSMLILVDKVLYQHMNTIAFDTRTCSGKYFSELPDSMDEADNHDIKDFKIRAGEYKFLTMNLSAQNFDYSELEKVVAENDVQGLSKVNITYKTYEEDAPVIDLKAYNISDANHYTHLDGKEARYVVDDRTPVAIDSVPVTKWGTNESRTVVFKPSPITHNIDLFFDIKKNTRNVNCIIESVYVILSGIPHKVNLSTGSLDISNTDKMFFKADLVSAGKVPYDGVPTISDMPGNATVRCYKNITVTGIVENEFTDRDEYYGPGMMQVVINTKVMDGGVYVPKTVNAMVNLHKSLLNAKLQYFDYEKNTYRKSRDHSDFYVSLNVVLDREALLGDGDGGIIKWQEADVPGEFNIY